MREAWHFQGVKVSHYLTREPMRKQSLSSSATLDGRKQHKLTASELSGPTPCVTDLWRNTFALLWSYIGGKSGSSIDPKPIGDWRRDKQGQTTRHARRAWSIFCIATIGLDLENLYRKYLNAAETPGSMCNEQAYSTQSCAGVPCQGKYDVYK